MTQHWHLSTIGHNIIVRDSSAFTWKWQFPFCLHPLYNFPSIEFNFLTPLTPHQCPYFSSSEGKINVWDENFSKKTRTFFFFKTIWNNEQNCSLKFIEFCLFYSFNWEKKILFLFFLALVSFFFLLFIVCRTLILNLLHFLCIS